MNYIKYIYIKLFYNFYKYFYLIIKQYNKLLFIYYYLLKIFNYLTFISDEFYYDYYHFKRNLSKSLKLYKKLGIFKHIFLIFFFFAGLIPLILFALFYLLLANKRPIDSRYNMLFVALLAIAFLQRAYPFWESWIIPFVSGMSFKFLGQSDNRLFSIQNKEQLSKVKQIKSI